MTETSVLCRFIKRNSSDWKAKLEERHIKIKSSNDGLLYIFNYDINADFHDPLVQESRGIIIAYPDDPVVVCWPYRKFGNLTEDYVDTIDWNHAIVEEKIDGSIIKLWYNPAAKQWQWSTNSTIDAAAAPAPDGVRSYLDLVKATPEYADIMSICDNGDLDVSLTYIFELTGPDNQIVIEYHSPKLYLTGIRNTEDGHEIDPWKYEYFNPVPIPASIPARYPLGSEADCIKAAGELNPAGAEVRKEGFVVVDPSAENPDGSFNRIKIKSPEYVALHHTIENGISKRKALDIILNHDTDNIPKSYKANAILSWYDYQYKNLTYSVWQYICFARGLLAELDGDRKAVAIQIKDDVFAPFGFAALGNDKTPEELLSHIQISVLERFIDDYVPDNIYRKKRQDIRK